MNHRGWTVGPLRGSLPEPAAPAIVKFGGSLLGRGDWPDLAATLLGDLPRTLVVGGGPVVDALRAIDRASPRPEPLMHRLAIDGMGITARLVAATLGIPLVASPGPRPAVLDMAAWLAAHPDLAGDVPQSWQATSDTLAACVAGRCGRLILAKSVPPPLALDADGDAASLRVLSAAGWVDDHFPTAATRLGQVAWASPAGRAPREA